MSLKITPLKLWLVEWRCGDKADKFATEYDVYQVKYTEMTFYFHLRHFLISVFHSTLYIFFIS